MDTPHTIAFFVGNKAKGLIRKRVFQENKAHQIFRKTNISYPLIRTNEVTNLNIILVIIFMKFLCVEKISNLQTISSSNVPDFLEKSKFSWIKSVIWTAHLLTKMKTLSVTLFFLVNRTWMTVKMPKLLMQH